MYRRNFIKTVPGAAAFAAITPSTFATPEISGNPALRSYWVSVTEKIIFPVLNELSKGTLKSAMPVEFKSGHENRKKHAYLEAFARTMAGVSPWLNLPEDSTAEGKLRKKFFDMALKCFDNGTNPNSPDYLGFNYGGQTLVDAAFLAHSLIRAPRLWESLDNRVRENVVKALLLTRAVKPGYNNWLLFSAMVEAFFFKYGYDYDLMRVDYALKKHYEWYKGDGMYGDGPDFHWDYYNSFVIQPMMLDIMEVFKEKDHEAKAKFDTMIKRMQRYAVIQERLISPEATFPPIGRSLAYRFGAFQALAQVCLKEMLPSALTPGQVKNALSHVIKRMIEAPGTFNKDGWLTIGFYGEQKNMGEIYINSGSIYLCCVGLLPLGLPASATFWTSEPGDWTAKKIWAGLDMPADSALY